jgi:hypothetical protein
VASTQEDNILRTVATSPSVGLDVVELEMAPFRAAATALINKGALPSIPRINRPPDRSRDVARRRRRIGLFGVSTHKRASKSHQLFRSVFGD